MKKKSILLRIIALLILYSLLLSINFFSFHAFGEIKDNNTKSASSIDKNEDVLNRTFLKQICITKNTKVKQDTKEVSSTEEKVNSIELPEIEPLNNLKVVDSTKSSVSLMWDISTGVTGYNIYIRDEYSEEYIKVYSTNENQITIANLENGSVYYFKVAPYVDQYGNICEGSYQEVSACTSSSSIDSLKLERSSDVIRFSWKKVSGASGYEIEKADVNGDNEYHFFKKIEGIENTFCEDTDVVNGHAYYYSVRAYTEYNGQTTYSNNSIIRVVSGLTPVSLEITSQVRRVSLSWDRNDLAEGYDIYYSTNETGPYTLLDSTTSQFFNTVRLKDGTKYYFKVIPFRHVSSDNFKVSGSYTIENITCTKNAFDEEVGDTYIEVSTNQQKLWFYIDGELYIETDVVTGNVGARATPKGCHTIFQRQSPAVLVGDDYRTTVNYWLAFTKTGCGIHDATWRSSFGGNIYTYDGSHGCVNTPINEVRQIYDKASIGDKVIVY